MIGFKQFLEESANYPLYHGTTLESLVNIIKTNTISTGFISKDHWPSKSGAIISTTRSFKFARSWAKETDITWVVIELDRAKLKNNYKITPFNYFGSELTDDKPQARWRDGGGISMGGVDRNQFEEAISKDIKPALKYIKTVYMDNKTKEIFKMKYSAEYSVLIRFGMLK